MPHSKTSKTVRLFVRRFFIALFFVTTAGALIVFALGYKINLDRLKLVPTGGISIQGNVSDIKLLVGNQLAATKLPTTLTSLEPGHIYTLSITKTGYWPWQESAEVQSGLLATFGPVRLWPQDPHVVKTDAVDKQELCTNNRPSTEDTLVIQGGELRTTKRLITRLSHNLTDACWFEDKNHIAYLNTRDVHIVEADGTNDTLIHTASEDPTEVAVDSSGNAVYYHAGDTWMKIEL